MSRRSAKPEGGTAMNEFDAAFYQLVGNKLRMLRKSGGLTLELAAERLGTTAKTIQRYEKGERKITAATLKALVEVLNGEYDAFLQSVRLENPNAFRSPLLETSSREVVRGRQIPILGQMAAGIPILSRENIEGYTIADLSSGAEYFALRVHGDGMNALGVQEGGLLIVRQQENVENGDVAVVRVGDESATVQRFYQMDSTVTLIPPSTNLSRLPQVYDIRRTPIQVFGKVVKVEFSL